MRILHFVSGSRSHTAATVAEALARRGGEQTLVLASASGGERPGRDIPCAIVDLPLGSGSAAESSADVMIGVEQALAGSRPDFLVVYASDDAALAATLAAVKLGVAVARVVAADAGAASSGPTRSLIDRLATVVFEPAEAGAAEAAERIAGWLEAEARPDPEGWPGRDLKPPPVERIIEARL